MKQEFQYSETHCGAAPCRPDVHGVLIKGKRGRLLSVLYTAAGGGHAPDSAAAPRHPRLRKKL